MRFLRGLPAALALLALAAHLLRSGWLPLVALPLLLVPLSFAQAPWAVRTCRAALGLGTLEWLRTLAVLAAARSAAGAPWGRLALILGTVAACTAGSALLLRTPAKGPA